MPLKSQEFNVWDLSMKAQLVLSHMVSLERTILTRKNQGLSRLSISVTANFQSLMLNSLRTRWKWSELTQTEISELGKSISNFWSFWGEIFIKSMDATQEATWDADWDYLTALKKLENFWLPTRRLMSTANVLWKMRILDKLLRETISKSSLLHSLLISESALKNLSLSQVSKLSKIIFSNAEWCATKKNLLKIDVLSPWGRFNIYGGST